MKILCKSCQHGNECDKSIKEKCKYDCENYVKEVENMNNQIKEVIRTIDTALCEIFNRSGSSNEMWAKWCELTKKYFDSRPCIVCKKEYEIYGNQETRMCDDCTVEAK